MIRWTLKKTLDERDITPYKLAKEVNLSPTTVYGMAQGSHDNATLATLSKVMKGIERLSGTPCELDEIVQIS